MQVEIITMWYNESFLAPFFLEHYSYADMITVFFDSDTTDDTLSILQQYPKVRVIPFSFPQGFDDAIKQNLLNGQYRESSCDWAILVDSDEFIFIKKDGQITPDIRDYLRRNNSFDIHFAPFFQVFRHAGDADLDPSLPAVPQRRHGDPDIISKPNAMHCKPCIARCGLGVAWKPGCHKIQDASRYLVAPHYQRWARSWNPIKRFKAAVRHFRKCGDLLGAHWALADPGFAVERRIKNRKLRQSPANLKNNYGCHYNDLTEEHIRNQCARFLHAPKLF